MDDYIFTRFEDMERAFVANKNYAASAGYFILAFSSVEAGLNRTLATFLKSKSVEAERAITVPIHSVDVRIRMLASLGSATLSKRWETNDFEVVIDALDWINKKRNNFIHSEMLAWQPDSETLHVAKLTAQRQIKSKNHEFSAIYLRKLACFCGQTAAALTAFRINRRKRRRAVSLPSLGKPQ